MRLTITSLAIVIIGWLVCGQTAAGQQNDESARATLRGIRRVAVVVSFQGDAVFQQFEKAPIIKDVEQRLVMAGLSVVSLNQVVNGIASGEKVTAPPDYLYVYANAVKSPVSPFCATSVSIEVNRRVRLDGIQQSARAVTWKTTRLFMFVSSALRDSLRDAINKEMDEFIKAYVSANGKQ